MNFKHDTLCEVQGSISSFFDFRVLKMSCIWKNIIKLSLSSWWMWLEMGNRMIDKDFEFQTWHAMWSSRLHIFHISTSGSSRCVVFENIFTNHHYKTSGVLWSRKKEDMEPLISHTVSRLKFKIIIYHPIPISSHIHHDDNDY